MKKQIKKLKEKTVAELLKEEQVLRRELTKLQLEAKVNAPKDTNFLMKKRKNLANILTILSEKHELESLQKEKLQK